MFETTLMQPATKSGYVWIGGQKLDDDTGLAWTIALIETAYYNLCKANGQLNPPPLEWYPLNILCYPNYSISKRGKVMNNQLDRLVEGFWHESGKRRVSITDINHRKQYEYVDRLVAKMFVGPPPHPTAIIRHLYGNADNCEVSNLIWVVAKKAKKGNTPMTKLSAKSILIPPSSSTDTTFNAAIHAKKEERKNKEKKKDSSITNDDDVWSKLSAVVAREAQAHAHMPVIVVKCKRIDLEAEEEEDTSDVQPGSACTNYSLLNDAE